MLFMFIFALTILVLIVASIWSFFSYSDLSRSLRYRLPTIYGALGGIASLWLPWISFSLLEDIDLLPPLVMEALPVALEILSDLLKFIPLGIVGWILELTTSLPGYLLLIPMSKAHWPMVFAVVVPAVAGLISLVTGLVAFLAAGRLAGKIAGWVQLIISLAGVFMLLAEMPRLDQWGMMGNFKGGLLAVSLGAGLDWGTWIAFASLVLMGVGAFFTLLESDDQPSSGKRSYKPVNYNYRSTLPWRD